MIPANDKIIVEVNYDQKKSITVDNISFLLAKDFSTNRRESMPVVCKVVNSNSHIKEGTFLLVHHNRFTEGNPHHLGGNLYSLAYNSSIFARLDEDGNAIGLCDNIIVSYIYEDDNPLIPDHLKKPHKFKYKVLSKGFGYKKGQIIYCYEKSNYEIVYVFNNIEHRVIKVAKTDIVGKIPNIPRET